MPLPEIAGLVVAVVVGLLLLAAANARPDAGAVQDRMTGCAPDYVAARLDVELTNTVDRDVVWEADVRYVADGGQLLDTDHIQVIVPAGETVLHRETTLTPLARQFLDQCQIGNISVSWR